MASLLIIFFLFTYFYPSSVHRPDQIPQPTKLNADILGNQAYKNISMVNGIERKNSGFG